jgi:hypothetical protein
MPVITDESSYISGLLKEIARIKENKGRVLYRINDELIPRVVKRTEIYFKNTPGYTIETIRCARCTNVWDVIIRF